jgi:hypothetical protein
VERVGHQLEGNGPIGQGGGLIDQLFAGGVLDPELALVGADAVHRALVELGPLAVAGLIDGKLDGRRTAVQNQYGQGSHVFNPYRLGLSGSAELVEIPGLKI